MARERSRAGASGAGLARAPSARSGAPDQARGCLRPARGIAAPPSGSMGSRAGPAGVRPADLRPRGTSPWPPAAGRLSRGSRPPPAAAALPAGAPSQAPCRPWRSGRAHMRPCARSSAGTPPRSGEVFGAHADELAQTHVLAVEALELHPRHRSSEVRVRPHVCLEQRRVHPGIGRALERVVGLSVVADAFEALVQVAQSPPHAHGLAAPVLQQHQVVERAQ